MSKKEIIKLTKKISEPIATRLGFELVDVEFVKEGSNYFLRIYIDRPNGINIDDCQKLSELVSNKLDELDPINVGYYLEVSSPGLDRPLKTDKDLQNNIGKDIDIKLYKNINNKKDYTGELIEFNEDIVKIIDEEIGEIDIPRNIISKINLAVKF